jgi:hypothetical protein
MNWQRWPIDGQSCSQWILIISAPPRGPSLPGNAWQYYGEGTVLREWWRAGNHYELEEFFQTNGIGTVGVTDILNRWSDKIPT